MEAKKNIVRYQRPDDFAVLRRRTPGRMSFAGATRRGWCRTALAAQAVRVDACPAATTSSTPRRRSPPPNYSASNGNRHRRRSATSAACPTACSSYTSQTPACNTTTTPSPPCPRRRWRRWNRSRPEHVIQIVGGYDNGLADHRHVQRVDREGEGGPLHRVDGNEHWRGDDRRAQLRAAGRGRRLRRPAPPP